MFDTSVVTISLVCGDPMMFHYKFAIDCDLLLSIYNCHLVSIQLERLFALKTWRRKG